MELTRFGAFWFIMIDAFVFADLAIKQLKALWFAETKFMAQLVILGPQINNMPSKTHVIVLLTSF